MTLPSSVFELAESVKAHPWVVRIKVDASTFATYIQQLHDNSRVTPSGFEDDKWFTIRHRVCVIHERAWAHRREIWPERLYRRAA